MTARKKGSDVTDWYFADDTRQRQGPFPAQELADRVRAGTLAPDTLVWRDGLAQWQPLRQVMHELGLADLQPAPLPRDSRQAAPVSAVPLLAVPLASASPQFAPMVPGEIVYAGFWKRVAASVIDSFVVSIVGGTIGAVILGVLGLGFGMRGGLESTGFIAIQILTNLVSIALAAAYYAWFHASRHQATLGKLAIGIKVVRTDGSPISLARGIGRYFALMLSSLLLGIGLLMAAFTQRKQGLHDLLCDTLVVDRWAFSPQPECQRRELGTVTIVVLAVFGFMMLLAIALLGLLFGVLATQFGHH